MLGALRQRGSGGTVLQGLRRLTNKTGGSSSIRIPGIRKGRPGGASQVWGKADTGPARGGFQEKPKESSSGSGELQGGLIAGDKSRREGPGVRVPSVGVSGSQQGWSRAASRGEVGSARSCSRRLWCGGRSGWDSVRHRLGKSG